MGTNSALFEETRELQAGNPPHHPGLLGLFLQLEDLYDPGVEYGDAPPGGC